MSLSHFSEESGSPYFLREQHHKKESKLDICSH
jgi:hypothetical protein